MDLLLAGAWPSTVSRYTWGMGFLSCVVDGLSVYVLVLSVSLKLAVAHIIIVLLACIISGLCEARSKY